MEGDMYLGNFVEEKNTKWPLYFWRVWRLDSRYNLISPLASPHGRVVRWAPEMEAICDCQHPAPTKGCHCGFYAYDDKKTAEDFARWLRLEDFYCVGVVSLKGRVLLHEHGARGQFASPDYVTVYLPWGGVYAENILSVLGRRYPQTYFERY
jgi:hypothetical protein